MAHILTRSERDRIDENTLIIFDHIPKCAGTSFTAWLAASHKMLRLDRGEDFPAVRRLADGKGKAIAGHRAWGVHELFPKSVAAAYVTMLRDPLQLAISKYKYWQNTFDLDCDQDLDSFLLAYTPNFLTLWLGGGDLKRAKKKIFETYCAFGIVERIEESIRNVGATLGPKAARQPFAKVNVSRQKTLRINDDTREYFRKVNAEDYELYDSAVEELERRIDYMDAKPEDAEPVPSPAKLHYTNVLEDVAASFKDNAGEGLRLLLAKDPATLSVSSLQYACRLARQCGDEALADLAFRRAMSRYPHDTVCLYVDFLLSLNRNAEAVRVVEAELAEFGSLAGIDPETLLYRLYFDMCLLALKTLRRCDAKRAESVLTEMLAACARSRRLFVPLLETLCATSDYERLLNVFEGLGKADDDIRLQCLKSVAQADYELGRFAAAGEACAAILRRLPLDPYALKMSVVLDRRSRAFSLPMEPILEIAQAFPGTLFSADLFREIAIRCYEAGDYERAFAILREHRSPFQEGLIASAAKAGRAVAFSAFDPGDCLVIKSGPSIVFGQLCAELFAKTGQKFDLIGSAAGLPPALARLARTSVSLPPITYKHDDHFADVRARLGREAYARCIVVISPFRLDAYAEILKLAAALCSGPIFVYSLDHVFSQTYGRTLSRIEHPAADPKSAAPEKSGGAAADVPAEASRDARQAG